MNKVVLCGAAALAVATLASAPVAPASAEGDCGRGEHATRTASTSMDSAKTAPQTPVAQPKSGG